eukprot:165260-Pelagomonas_calceolata.AAC.2
MELLHVPTFQQTLMPEACTDGVVELGGADGHTFWLWPWGRPSPESMCLFLASLCGMLQRNAQAPKNSSADKVKEARWLRNGYTLFYMMAPKPMH